MSRAKGPRLHLKRYRSGERYWIIRDRAAELGTGCREGQLAEAERRLAAYIAEKYQPETRARALGQVLIADVVNLYLNEVMPHVANPSFIAYTAEPILEWWGAKTLADIRGRSCRDYVDWRTSQRIKRRKQARRVSDQTARHELKTLRAAINHYHREYGPLDAVPALTLPRRSPPKDRHLTRSEVARYTGCLMSRLAGCESTGSGSKLVLRRGWVDVGGSQKHERSNLQAVRC